MFETKWNKRTKQTYRVQLIPRVCSPKFGQNMIPMQFVCFHIQSFFVNLLQSPIQPEKVFHHCTPGSIWGGLLHKNPLPCLQIVFVSSRNDRLQCKFLTADKFWHVIVLFGMSGTVSASIWHYQRLTEAFTKKFKRTLRYNIPVFMLIITVGTLAGDKLWRDQNVCKSLRGW